MAKAKKTRTRGAPRAKEAPVSDRREAILKALNRCILRQGFSRSSLTDIAVEAGMSPSHIRYYFEGRDAILEAYQEQICAQILESIRAIEATDPDEWFNEFVTYFIATPWLTPARLNGMLEIYGISVHDKALRRTKADFDTEIRRILTRHFERIELVPSMTATAAAEIAQALEAGLKYTAAFQGRFDPIRAQERFVSTIRLMVSGTDKRTKGDVE